MKKVLPLEFVKEVRRYTFYSCSLCSAVDENRIGGCPSLTDIQIKMQRTCLVSYSYNIIYYFQFTGQPNVMYYAPTVFQSLGFHSNTAATLATVGLGSAKVYNISTYSCSHGKDWWLKIDHSPKEIVV